jgi:hypothetical protein
MKPFFPAMRTSLLRLTFLFVLVFQFPDQVVDLARRHLADAPRQRQGAHNRIVVEARLTGGLEVIAQSALASSRRRSGDAHQFLDLLVPFHLALLSRHRLRPQPKSIAFRHNVAPWSPSRWNSLSDRDIETLSSLIMLFGMNQLGYLAIRALESIPINFPLFPNRSGDHPHSEKEAVMGMRSGYARVSSSGQKLDVQLDRLADCDRIFHEKASGASARARSEPQKALDYVRDEDVLIKLDRLARSVVDSAGIVQIFERKKVDLVVLDQGIDTPTCVAACSSTFWQLSVSSRGS